MIYRELTGETHYLDGVNSFEDAYPVPVGDNLWFLDLGTDYWNPILYLRVLELDEQKPLTMVMKSDGSFANGDNQLPGANGEWARSEGSELQTSAALIYWDREEAPTVRYGRAQKPALEIINCEDCTFVVTNGGPAGIGIKVSGSTNCKITGQFPEVGRGVEVKDSCCIVVSDCDLSNVGEVGIRYNASTGIAEYNTIINGGLSESIAGIYLSNSVQGVRTRDNNISQITHGNYWPHDGCAIFTENGSANNKVLNNNVYDCEYAFKDNSGKAGNRFYGNRITDCHWAFQQSDSKGYGEADTVFELNHLSGTNTFQPNGSVLLNNIIQ